MLKTIGFYTPPKGLGIQLRVPFYDKRVFSNSYLKNQTQILIKTNDFSHWINVDDHELI